MSLKRKLEQDNCEVSKNFKSGGEWKGNKNSDELVETLYQIGLPHVITDIISSYFTLQYKIIYPLFKGPLLKKFWDSEEFFKDSDADGKERTDEKPFDFFIPLDKNGDKKVMVEKIESPNHGNGVHGKYKVYSLDPYFATFQLNLSYNDPYEGHAWDCDSICYKGPGMERFGITFDTDYGYIGVVDYGFAKIEELENVNKNDVERVTLRRIIGSTTDGRFLWVECSIFEEFNYGLLFPSIDQDLLKILESRIRETESWMVVRL